MNEIDLSKYMPEGYSASDMREVQSLTPIYVPEMIKDRNYEVEPACGHMVGVEQFKQQGDFTPTMIRLVLTSPTIGGSAKGADGAREVVELRAGDEILIPVNKNLANNYRILAAANDPDHVHFAVFLCAGQKKLNNGKPNPMWDWRVHLSSKTFPRKGTKYDLALPASSGAILAEGVIVDGDGVVQDRIVGSPRPTAQA